MGTAKRFPSSRTSCDERQFSFLSSACDYSLHQDIVCLQSPSPSRCARRDSLTTREKEDSIGRGLRIILSLGMKMIINRWAGHARTIPLEPLLLLSRIWTKMDRICGFFPFSRYLTQHARISNPLSTIAINAKFLLTPHHLVTQPRLSLTLPTALRVPAKTSPIPLHRPLIFFKSIPIQFWMIQHRRSKRRFPFLVRLLPHTLQKSCEIYRCLQSKDVIDCRDQVYFIFCAD